MNIEEMLEQARESWGNAVTRCQIDLLKAVGEYRKLGGTGDYKSSLLAIVAGFGAKGVMYSLVREVLHDTEKLGVVIAELVSSAEISRGPGKRDFLLTSKKPASQQPSAQLVMDVASEDAVPLKNATPPAPQGVGEVSTKPAADGEETAAA